MTAFLPIFAEQYFSQMLWHKLTKAALLGTENSQLEKTALIRLSELGIDTHQEAPVVLANGISMLAQMRKAGFQLSDYKGEMPSLANKGNAHSPKALRLLHFILSGPHSDVLPEYLLLLKVNDKALPASELPALLAKKDLPSTWPQVAPLIGEDGRWLLRQHPEWSSLLEDPTQYNWHTGSRQERLKMLDFWRKQSPKFALELVQSTWETEQLNDKTSFLANLQTNLSLDDEPFLESCRSDKRKEVRQVAAALLAKIIGSGLAARLEGRVLQVVSVKNGKLQVALPEELDESAMTDGIQKLHPEWQGGAKASFLGQIVSRINPAFWESHLNRSPKAIISLFFESDWAQTLRQALIAAAVFHQKTDWAAHLAEHLLREEDITYNSLPRLDALLELLPTSTAHQFAMQRLSEATELPTQYSIPYFLLYGHEAIWPDEISRLIIKRFRKEIYKDYRQFWQMQHLHEWLKLLGLRSNPSLYDEFQSGWTNTDFQWRYWEKPVEEMLAKLIFRKELRNELGSNG